MKFSRLNLYFINRKKEKQPARYWTYIGIRFDLVIITVGAIFLKWKSTCLQLPLKTNDHIMSKNSLSLLWPSTMPATSFFLFPVQGILVVYLVQKCSQNYLKANVCFWLVFWWSPFSIFQYLNRQNSLFLIVYIFHLVGILQNQLNSYNYFNWPCLWIKNVPAVVDSEPPYTWNSMLWFEQSVKLWHLQKSLFLYTSEKFFLK